MTSLRALARAEWKGSRDELKAEIFNRFFNEHPDLKSGFVRLYNVTSNADIHSLKALSVLGAKGFKQVKNVGQKTVDVAREMLQFYGLKFKDDTDEDAGSRPMSVLARSPSGLPDLKKSLSLGSLEKLRERHVEIRQLLDMDLAEFAQIVASELDLDYSSEQLRQIASIVMEFQEMKKVTSQLSAILTAEV